MGQEGNNIRAGIITKSRPWDVRRRDLLCQKVLPYDLLESGVREDISSALILSCSFEGSVSISLRIKSLALGLKLEGWPLNDTRPCGDLAIQCHRADLRFVDMWLSKRISKISAPSAYQSTLLLRRDWLTTQRVVHKKIKGVCVSMGKRGMARRLIR